MAVNLLLFASAVSFAQSNLTGSATKKLIILHTNDLQSKLLGSGPNAEYSPETTGDDPIVGGFARLATVIKNLKQQAPDQTLVLDGGDMLMGSLFHTIAREEGGEFQLMGAIGYDAATLGNHEFDFRPSGLARMLDAVRRKGGAIPQLLLANAEFSQVSPQDDTLQRQFDQGFVRPYYIFSRSGMRIGIFGLMGKDAAEVAPFARPVTFSDPIETARALAKMLKEREQVDLVIALSHSGVRQDKAGEWYGEDIDLARKVKDVDVVISGHSHVLTPQPIMVNGTPVVQAGEHGQHIGKLELTVGDSGLRVLSYEVIDIDDSIPGDAVVQKEIARLEGVVSRKVLKPFGYTFDQPIAETKFDLILKQQESGIGNLVTDAIRWGIDRVDSSGAKLDVAVEANGQIRDDFFKGTDGVQWVSDAFRTVGLGIGIIDDVPGFPLVKMYVTASEIKKALEVLASVHPMKGPSYFMQVSGLRFRYNPNRVIFDRVFKIEMEDSAGNYRPLDFSSSNEKLYSVGFNYYIASFIKVIGGFTYGILDIVPKNAQGQPLNNMRDAIVDADPVKPGVQELKEWVVLLDYLKQLEDTDGNGIADIPEKYRQPQERIVRIASWNPILLLKSGNYLTWTTVALILTLILLLVVLPVFRLRKRLMRNKIPF
ncbi:bifunctional metallophosphatase/5'-nucleotidase [candidate division KSB1 bacterium]|nr:bifunctional metallophosphatase/5'-nucleotidase [candidate division KSB1 bacterium]